MIKDKPLILSIETATNICSVALSYGENILAYEECREQNSHSKMLSVLIEKLFKYTYYSLQEIDCVAVSKGPGSYTGLRIGVSTAKGIAYGLSVPLISVETLQILAYSSMQKYPDCCYMPMIDARRMEVYTAMYDKDFNVLKPISADIIDKDLYTSLHKDRKIVLCGDGAEKCKDILNNEIYIYDLATELSAKDMIHIATKKFEAKDFEDTAYFEPYYLKEFVAQKSHVKGLYD
ncbi:MAG: tRNA (adenosine(37)-N6)-threonylcarbamoyltransferase complex dimerization subunit type 1 TsaB [Bacteroidales bacterium]|nr:tRNA (adenosine(37)-N6)-threonylcarbamoyltransferase complex dimerization subunit type 1 TsaB [Bacteroidales bacterium]